MGWGYGGINSSLESPLKKISKYSLIVHGIGYITMIVGLYILYGTSFLATSYMVFDTFDPSAIGLYVLIIIGATALLLTGIFVVRAGKKIGKGALPRNSIYLPILMFAIFLLIAGISGLIIAGSSYYAKTLTTGSILSIISAVLLIAAPVIYMRGTQASRIVGSIVSIASIALLMAAGRTFLNSVFDLRNLYFADLIGGELTYTAFIVCAAAALMYAFINKKYVEIVYVVAVIGFILYGSSITIQTLDVLSSPVWSLPAPILALMAVLLAGIIILSISGFMILASSGIGLAVFLRKVFPSINELKSSSASSQTTSVVESDVVYCQKCGTKVDNDAEFCKKCGNKLN